jgi:hypothetical protein
MAATESKSFVLKYGSLILSSLALCISSYTFWKTQFYDPDLKFATGESLAAGHFKEGNGQIVLPLVAMNQGNKPQVIDRVALRVTPPTGSSGYLFEPYYYQKIDANGNFTTESNPEPILVQGNGMVLKHVLFRSAVDRPFRFTRPGVYKGQILSWTRGSNQPSLSQPFDFRVDSTLVAMMATNSGVSRIPLRKYEQWSAGPTK